MRCKVPQNVEREDQILPFLTIRQLIIMSIWGGVSYVVFSVLSKMFYIALWGPIVLFPLIAAWLIAYITINGITFSKWFLLIIEHSLIAKKRVWNNSYSIENEMKAIISPAVNSHVKMTESKNDNSQKKNKNLIDIMKDFKKKDVHNRLSIKKIDDNLDDEEQLILNRLDNVSSK